MTRAPLGGHAAARLGGAVALGAGLAAACVLRLAVAGSPSAASAPAGIVFAAALLALAAGAGWRPGIPRLRGIGAGVLGGLVLAAPPTWLRLRGVVITAGPAPLAGLPAWAAVVVAVALAEEVLLRGSLLDAVDGLAGSSTAVAVAAAGFALMHVPFYGWGAVPLDGAVGVWFGALRVASGTVSAPACAHAVADLAAWWLR